jgi:hypothetical protein
MNTFAEDASRFERPVVCQWWNNKHRTMFPHDLKSDDATCGDACAISVWRVDAMTKARLKERGVQCEVGDWMANGHYGANNFDTQLWKWVKNFPRENADPICDNCLGERISAGDLVHIEGSFP